MEPLTKSCDTFPGLVIHYSVALVHVKVKHHLKKVMKFENNRSIHIFNTLMTEDANVHFFESEPLTHICTFTMSCISRHCR